MKWDVIIVGAGAGGLAAATLLGSQGKRVLVLEAGAAPGGKIGTASFEGVEFDTGPSVLTMPDVVRDLFQAAGTSMEAELELIEHERAFQYRFFDGCALDVFFDPAATEESVRQTLGGEAAAEFTQFLAYARKVWESAAPHFVYGPAPSFSTAIQMLPKWKEFLGIDPMRGMWSAIKSQVRSPYLRDIFARYATYNGSDPRFAPATLNCIAWVELGAGSYGVKGGMIELARALTRVAERQGVEFRYHSAVERIQISDGQVQGVVLDGDLLSSAYVLSNVDVRHLVKDLAPGVNLKAEGTPSMSGWTALIKATRDADRVPHQVLFPENYHKEFEDIFDANELPSDPTIYLCAQEQAHLRTGWADHEPLFAMINCPAGFQDTGALNAMRKNVLQKLITQDVISAGDQIVWERTPQELGTQFPRSQGSLYGDASNSRFAAFQRTPNEIREVRGLYTAGGGSHPGGGVPLCLLSGRAASVAIAKRQKP